jgi:hypothetical protein
VAEDDGVAAGDTAGGEGSPDEVMPFVGPDEAQDDDGNGDEETLVGGSEASSGAAEFEGEEYQESHQAEQAGIFHLGPEDLGGDGGDGELDTQGDGPPGDGERCHAEP